MDSVQLEVWRVLRLARREGMALTAVEVSDAVESRGYAVGPKREVYLNWGSGSAGLLGQAVGKWLRDLVTRNIIREYRHRDGLPVVFIDSDLSDHFLGRMVSI